MSFLSSGMLPGTSLGEVGGDRCFMLISSTHQWSQDVCFITKNSSFLQNLNVVSCVMFPVFSSWSTKVQEAKSIHKQYIMWSISRFSHDSDDWLINSSCVWCHKFQSLSWEYVRIICFFPIRWHLGHFIDHKFNQLINKINQQLDQC